MGFQSRRPLVPATLALVAGVATGSVFSSGLWPVGVGVFCAMGGAWFLVVRWSERAGHLLSLGAVAVAGVALAGIGKWDWDPRAVHRLGLEGTGLVQMVGRVVTMPELRGAGAELPRLEFVLGVEWVKRDGEDWRRASGRVRVLVRSALADGWGYGRQVVVRGALQRMAAAVNPGQYDARAHWLRKGVRLECRVGPEAVRCAGANRAGWAEGTASVLRGHMRETLALGIAGDRRIAAVIAGMLYGDRAGFDEGLLEAFRRTGTMHLFAVSGQNVGVIAMAGIVVLRWLGLNRWRWGWVVVPVLGLYTLATGAQASAVRAFGMAALVLLAWVMDRPVAAGQLLAGAAFMMLLSDAMRLWDVGFQLSFSVVLALVMMTPPIYGRLERLGAPDPLLPRRLWPRWLGAWERVRRAIVGTVAASLAAFVGSAPLTAWYFHLFSPASVAVNVAVVPLAALVVVAGGLSLVAGALHPMLAVACNKCNWLLASTIVGLVEFAAGLPMASVNVGVPAWGCEAHVVALAVGEGQAAIVRSGGRCEMFDCGASWQGRGVVAPALRYFGVNRIDRLWLGHGDAAHVGGSEAVLGSWPVGRVVVPGSEVRRGALADVLGRHGTRARVVRRGDVFDVGRVRWEVLHPGRAAAGPLADDRGVVARLEWEGGAMLFMGDSGASVERELLGAGCELRADVIVAGKHAREGSLGEEFLDAVRPEHIIFNAGWRAGEALDGDQRRRIAERGVVLWDLSETGAVGIRCGKRGARVGALVRGRGDNQ